MKYILRTLISAVISFLIITVFTSDLSVKFKGKYENHSEIVVIADTEEKTYYYIVNGKEIADKILKVPYMNQKAYPTGCESVSTVMVLNYWGINITADDFIDNYLDKSSLQEINGIKYGESPNDSFIGNPREKSGFGCYAPCIVKACNKFITSPYTVKNLTGTDFTELEKYIDNDIPVIVWITISLKEPIVSTSWILKDSNHIFFFLGNEHCAVLIGYDDIYYYFNDPISGIVAYRKDIVSLRYAQMGKQAVVIYKE